MPTPNNVGSRPIRILHAPWNIGGQASMLAHFERELGLDSRAVVLRDHETGFPADEALTGKDARGLTVEKARWTLLMRAIWWADVVHLNFGQSILVPEPYPDVRAGLHHSWKSGAWQAYARAFWFADLPLLRAVGKKIVVTWQGDDARQGDISRRLFDISIAERVTYYNPISDAWKRRAIKKIDRHAHKLFALNPDLLHVLPQRAEFLAYANIDVRTLQPAPPTNDGVPIILHAPSHRGAKGTDVLLDALSRLRSDGVAFELDLVEGLTRPEALERYRRADIAVDQLFAGWYGGFAVEAMALGKPVVCYLREGDLKYLPTAMRAELPIIRSDAMRLYDVLKSLLTDHRRTWAALGMASRRFVERWHDPRLVAVKLADTYADLLCRHSAHDNTAKGLQ